MRQTVITVFALLLIAGVAYVWFQVRRGPSASPGSATLDQASEERLNEYRRLKNLRPDISVLSHPVFRALQRPGTLRTTTTPPGRLNPFAPF